MTSNPTPEQVRASIVPKSDQLNADDMIAGPMTVTVTAVTSGNKEQPIIVETEGKRPYKPCKTMRRILVAVYSDDSTQWIGQRMTLFRNPEVKWGGVRVGGIQISHLSGLDEPKTFMITLSRGKRVEITILPLASVSDEDAAYIEATRAVIAKAGTPDALKSLGQVLKKKSTAVQDALRPAYIYRVAELEQERQDANPETADE